jgi:hypothetical protein
MHVAAQAAGQQSTAPLRGFRCRPNAVPDGKEAAPERGLCLGQYSLASMIVKTLTVCFGSAGFSLPCCMSGA